MYFHKFDVDTSLYQCQIINGSLEIPRFFWPMNFLPYVFLIFFFFSFDSSDTMLISLMILISLSWNDVS